MGNTFDPNKDIPDLSGKVFLPHSSQTHRVPLLIRRQVYIVTGGSAGIGFGIVAHLLQHNAAKIIVLSNKEEHADEAMEEIKEYGDTSRVHWEKCNLADLRQTDQVSKKLLAEEKRIDCVSQPHSCHSPLTHTLYVETLSILLRTQHQLTNCHSS